MEGAIRGMPLLSGPPTTVEGSNTSSCRKCAKELNFFTRSKQCNHCGYTYCSSCSDNQALMPRTGSNETGYDPAAVCNYCIEYLTVTAAGKAQLRELPVAKLRGYLKAYGIPIPSSALEKEDLVLLIVSSRMENGCLPPQRESYYRRNSVPSQQTDRPRRTLFDRFGDAARQATSSVTSSNSNSQPARPPTVPRQSRPPTSPTQQPRSYAAPRPQTEPQSRPSGYQPPYHSRPPPPTNSRPTPVPPQPNYHQYPSAGNRPTPTPTPRQAPPRPPSPPVPALASLLNSSHEMIAAMPVHTLKEILHQNHVNARLILEKSDLVEKVVLLVEAERRERAREEEIRALEEAEILERQARNMEAFRANEVARSHSDQGHSTSDEKETVAVPPMSSSLPKALPMISHVERSGLCVICQDDEANIALVDCGHLALCMGCSDLVMKTSRECPLCRTRIVTADRMLRVFKT